MNDDFLVAGLDSYGVSPWETEVIYGLLAERFRVKQKRPPFPSTFVFEDYVYEQWNQDLIDNYGSTKEEIKQGWRWKEL